MQTILDTGYTWILDSLVYRDELVISLVEGVKSDTPRDLKFGDALIRNASAIEATAISRRVNIRFETPVVWHVIDESYAAKDETEVHDTEGYLRVLTKSKYLKYVDENHGWHTDSVGPASLYRIWTENEIIDVVAHAPPIITEE